MNQLVQRFRSLSLRKKWALASATVLFVSFTVVCCMFYIGIHSWLLNEEKSSVSRSMDDLTGFFESRGPDVTLDYIQRNTGLRIRLLIKVKQSVF